MLLENSPLSRPNSQGFTKGWIRIPPIFERQFAGLAKNSYKFLRIRYLIFHDVVSPLSRPDSRRVRSRSLSASAISWFDICSSVNPSSSARRCSFSRCSEERSYLDPFSCGATIFQLDRLATFSLLNWKQSAGDLRLATMPLRCDGAHHVCRVTRIAKSPGNDLRQ
jgi:hypothetical protein